MAIGLFARTLCVAALSAFVAFAAASESKATIQLRGVVAPKTSLTVLPEPGARSLPIGESVSELKIASIHEASNCSSGYSVAISTANGGYLKAEASGRSLAYSLSYGGKPIALSSGSAILSSPSSMAPGGSSTKELAISFSSANTKEDGYSDTITLSIIAK